MHRILITGSRNWTDEKTLYAALNLQLMLHGKDMIIVHGAAHGADSLAAKWASANRIKQEQYPAQWRRYGKGAGPIRNQEMVDLGADVCLAFPMPGSVGTLHCMRIAAKAGIPVNNLGV
jgi:hypothetical protein